MAHSYYPPYLNHNDRREDPQRPPVPGHYKVPEDQRANFEDFARFEGRVYAPDRILAEALQFVRENSARPFFLYLPFVEPHVAMQPPGEWVDAYPTEWDKKPYLGTSGYTPTRAPEPATRP